MMGINPIKDIKEKFGSKIKKIFEKSEKRAYLDIEPKDIPAVAKYVFRNLGARFNIASAIDTPEGIEILYHFELDEKNLIVTLKTLIEDKKHPEIESLTPMMKGAEWIEREIHELLGVEFINHPNLEHLLLPDDWPKGKYPLKRDFDQSGIKTEGYEDVA